MVADRQAQVRDVMALLQQGLAAERAGGEPGAAIAEGCYREALRRWPDNPDALQLLGLLARRRGDLEGGEQLMRRSLEVQPRQPHVWNNLGNLVAARGRADEALRCFARATELKPDHADAHFNAARVALAAGLRDAAAASIASALQCSPTPSAGLRQLQAQWLSDGGELEQALAVLDAALASHPSHAGLQHNRAVLLQRLHRPQLALQAHEQALALGLAHADADYNRGNTLQSLGRLDEAAQAYRAALAKEPRHALSLFDLARLRWRRGDPDFDAELRAALARDAHDPAPALVLGRLLLRAERTRDALEAFEQALARAPSAEAYDGRGRCRVRLGLVDEGLADQARAVALAPEVAQWRTNRIESLLWAGRPREAETASLDVLERTPDEPWALAWLDIAWRALRDPRADALLDVERFVGVIDLPPPADAADLGRFLRELCVELEALHVDRQAPVDQTLRHGTQTFGTLFEQPHPQAQRLCRLLEPAIDGFIRSLPEDPTHPFLKRRGARWRFTDSWSSRLSRHGFHTDHIHPHGWISGVVYLQVPERALDPGLQQGWLRLGRPDLDLSCLDLPAPERRRIPPRPGRLVLFPSTMWHGTTPFDSDEQRLTVAFDLVPA